MSRKYCSNCTRPHSNGGLGMCNECLEREEYERLQETDRRNQEFEIFMEQDEEDRWRELWEKING